MKQTLASPAQITADPSFAGLKEAIIDFTGLSYYRDKDDVLADRLLRRWEATHVSDCRSYLELLKRPGGIQELDALAVELTIGETYFFRHEDHFKALREVVIPELIRMNHENRQLRIWSAACATGAEAYSLSILLKRDFGPELAGWQTQILGTDINRRFLAQAMDARFDEWALRGVSQETKDACFSRQGSSWVLAPTYKEGVSFEYHNLIKNPFPSLLQNLAAFDLILCRNAMIYFNRDVNERVAQQFHQTLVDGGWFMAGYAESDRDLFRSFQPADVADATLFRKIHRQTPFGRAAESYVPPVFPEHQKVPIPSEPRREATSAAPEEDALARIRELADAGQWKEALQSCDALMRTDKLNPSLHYYRALIDEQMGHLSEAEGLLRQALYLDRTRPLVHYHLGLLLSKRAQRGPAAKSFENALELLRRKPMGDTLPDSDGISILDLRSLAQMQLEVLRGGARELQS